MVKSRAQADLFQEDRLLTEREVANRWCRAIKTLQNERVTGRGVRYVKIGRSVRYRLSDIEAYERVQTRSSTSEEG